jgi:hypothetical protein
MIALSAHVQRYYWGNVGNGEPDEVLLRTTLNESAQGEKL